MSNPTFATGTAAPEQLGGNNIGTSEGVRVGGTTTSLVGLYAATPVAQASAITATDTTAAVSSSPYGYSSSQANAIIANVNLIITALKNIGVTL